MLLEDGNGYRIPGELVVFEGPGAVAAVGEVDVGEAGLVGVERLVTAVRGVRSDWIL